MKKQIRTGRASRKISQEPSGAAADVRKLAVLLTGLALSLASAAQFARPATSQASRHPVAGPPVSKALGDAPAEPGSRTELSPALDSESVKAVMRLVADREWKRTSDAPSQDWTMVPLYLGLLSASRTLGEPKYHDEVLAHANGFGWRLGPRESHADDQAIGQVYVALYREEKNPARVASMRAQFDRLMLEPDPTRLNMPVWWWCDALFMAPPAWTGLAQVTGDKKYASYAYRQWQITSSLLWDSQQKLFSRDASYLDKHEANGQKLFWSRGNGWVLGGLARVLDTLPANDAHRPFYVEKLKDMAGRMAPLQGEDGLWRPGLLDAKTYPLPETSGSAFFLYALAWGVNHHVLQASEFMPVIRKGWAGLVANVYTDGRLGSVQPIGAAPGAYTAGAGYVYGSGALLLAAEEITKLPQ